MIRRRALRPLCSCRRLHTSPYAVKVCFMNFIELFIYYIYFSLYSHLIFVWFSFPLSEQEYATDDANEKSERKKKPSDIRCVSEDRNLHVSLWILIALTRPNRQMTKLGANVKVWILLWVFIYNFVAGHKHRQEQHTISDNRIWWKIDKMLVNDCSIICALLPVNAMIAKRSERGEHIIMYRWALTLNGRSRSTTGHIH